MTYSPLKEMISSMNLESRVTEDGLRDETRRRVEGRLIDSLAHSAIKEPPDIRSASSVEEKVNNTVISSSFNSTTAASRNRESHNAATTSTSKSIILTTITSIQTPQIETTTSFWSMESGLASSGALERLLVPDQVDLSRSGYALSETTGIKNISSTTQEYQKPQPAVESPDNPMRMDTPLTHTSRERSKSRVSRRRAQSNDSISQPSSTPKLQSGIIDDPCRENPCGQFISCHPTPGGENPFECICSNAKMIRPGGDCEIKELNIIPSLKPIPSKTYYNNDQSRNLIGIFFAASVLLMVILLVTYWRRKTLFALLRHRHREKKSGSSPALAKSSSLLTYNFASNPNYYAQAPDNFPLQTLAVQLIDKEQIAFVGELGEGCFGKVYKVRENRRNAYLWHFPLKGGLHGQTVRRTRFDRQVFEVMSERVNGVFGCRTRSENVFNNQIPRSHVRTSLQTLD
ncbi:hypothetical protein SK128_010408 [Halocaridina rubra]|uniref:EGF-like domain-containing protein n=1 Tax=Halocaridina rubra TaxID=373956 RepID=A0AAN8WF84_HALRR